MLQYTFKKGSDAAVNLTSMPYKWGNSNSSYAVHVEKSTGLIGKPSLKSVEQFDWKYLHGTTPDLRNRRYQNKEITLECWMTADSKQQLAERFDNFLRYFNYDDVILMKVTWDTDNDNGGAAPPNPHVAKGLFAIVYLNKVDGVKFKWHRGKNIVRFNLVFVDPYPVKRVYHYTGTSGVGVVYDIISDTEIDIFTDNGDRVYDILTETGKILCPINTYILVCGDIAHAKSNSFYYERADPEVPIDPTDPSTYVITEYKLVYPLDTVEDTVTTIYEEI